MPAILPKKSTSRLRSRHHEQSKENNLLGLAIAVIGMDLLQRATGNHSSPADYTCSSRLRNAANSVLLLRQ
jgi:hypothetical protein